MLYNQGTRPQPSLFAASKSWSWRKTCPLASGLMQKNFLIGKFLCAQGGGVYVWILLHARLELNAPSSYGLLVVYNHWNGTVEWTGWPFTILTQNLPIFCTWYSGFWRSCIENDRMWRPEAWRWPMNFSFGHVYGECKAFDWWTSHFVHSVFSSLATWTINRHRSSAPSYWDGSSDILYTVRSARLFRLHTIRDPGGVYTVHSSTWSADCLDNISFSGDWR